MNYILAVLIAGVMFWLGVMTEATKKPPPVVHRDIPVSPAKNLIPCNKHGYELYRQMCTARSRSL
jgi:hypothetical protein